MPLQEKIFLDLAGRPVRLEFADAGLGALCAAAFAGGRPRPLAGSAGPVFLVQIHGVADSASFADSATAAARLDGEDQYQALVDAAAGRARVLLTSATPADALVNFLRVLTVRCFLDNDSAVLHAACIQHRDAVLIFTGPSGAGKSTVARLSAPRPVLTDDLAVLRRRAGGFAVWGLPTPGSGYDFCRDRGPLPVAGIFTLIQDTRAFLRPLSAARAAAALFVNPVAVPPPARRPQTELELLAGLAAATPCHELHFRLDPDFWDCIERQYSSPQRTQRAQR